MGVSSKVNKAAFYSWSVLREAGASLLTYELYPLGIPGQDLPVVPNLWSRPASPKVPILFIHGVLHNGSAFAWMKQKLALAGWQNFKELNLSTTFYSISKMAEQAAIQVERLRQKHGVPQVDIVAHSMGGIISRFFIQILGGDGLVRNLVTLGTPHQGTMISKYAVLPHWRELAPDSKTLALLNSRPVPRVTQALAISGDLDVLMQPKECIWWNGVRHIHLKGVGHAGLLFSRRVVEALTATLGPTGFSLLSRTAAKSSARSSNRPQNLRLQRKSS